MKLLNPNITSVVFRDSGRSALMFSEFHNEPLSHLMMVNGWLHE